MFTVEIRVALDHDSEAQSIYMLNKLYNNSLIMLIEKILHSEQNVSFYVILMFSSYFRI